MSDSNIYVNIYHFYISKKNDYLSIIIFFFLHNLDLFSILWKEQTWKNEKYFLNEKNNG
jgi:hypothetical protein